MSTPLIISELARMDIADAKSWYEKAARGMGDQVASEIDKTITTIAERPRSFPEIEPSVRRALCDRFPYKIFFTIEPDQIVILAVYHSKRDPNRWRERG